MKDKRILFLRGEYGKGRIGEENFFEEWSAESEEDVITTQNEK